MLLSDKNETVVKEIPISDALGRVDVVDKVLRGAIVQPINLEQYSDEVLLRFLSCFD